MASQQEGEFRYFPPLKKENRRKTDLEELSYQIGRKMVGGDWNTQNPNILNYGFDGWINQMTSNRRLRKKAVNCLRDGIISVIEYRIRVEKANPTEINGPIMPLQNVAGYLDNHIRSKIGKGGKSGDESMAILKDLATSLFYCDKTPLSIKNIIRPFALKSIKS